MRGKPELIQLRDRNGHLKSPFWYIRFYDGRSQRVSTGYRIGTQDHEANLALAAFTLELDRPTRKPDELLIAQALDDYYREHAQYLASSEQAEYSEQKLKDFFKGQFVSQITQVRINDYVRHWQEQKRSNGTIRRDLEHLRAALNHEERERRLLYVPKFKLPPPPRPRERILSIDEVNRLIGHIKTDHIRDFAILMLDTGQRPGAIENLTWFQVDFDQKIIHFDKDGARETSKRKRPVPMSDEVYEILCSRHKVRETEYVLEYNGKHAGCVRKAF